MELLSENKILADLPDSGECSKVTPTILFLANVNVSCYVTLKLGTIGNAL